MDRTGDVDGAGLGASVLAGLDLTNDEDFRMFYETLQPAVFRLCRFQTGDAETALDLSQEAFARAFRARRDLQKPAGGRAWMLTIALNVCRTHGRRRRLAAFLRSLVPWNVGESEEPSDPGPGPAETAEQLERERQVRAAVALLPDRERSAVALVALQGLSYVEAAAALSCSEDSVRQGVCRARRRLRLLLGDDGVADDGALAPAGGRS